MTTDPPPARKPRKPDPALDIDRPVDAPTIEKPATSRRRFRRIRRRAPPRKRLSQLLDEIASDTSRARISIADIMQAMSGRATAALLLIFALPNVLPAPPGTSGILGLPLVYLSAQMLLGQMPWLPAFISGRSMTRADFGAVITRATPLLARAERLLKPRLPFLIGIRADRVVGAICLILSLVLILPIPLGNMLPALAIALISLGMLERDGLWVLGGITVGAGSLVLVAGIIFAMVKAAIYVVLNAF